MRIAMTNISSRTVLTLLAGTAACLSLAGCDESDNVIFVDDSPPAVPTGVYTITGDGWVEVVWNPVRQDDVEGYGVYRNRTLTGEYTRIGDATGVESTSFVDTDVQNGMTYFYAVDAYDFAGHESELSYEDAFDTPRPASDVPVDVFAKEVNALRSGIDFSDWSNEESFITAHDANDTDIVFQRIGRVLFAVGTEIAPDLWNDIQDLGYTDSMDEVSWAPRDGYSVAPNGVELIENHTYVVWTWELFFAKFRIVEILRAGGVPDGIPIGVRLEWAYQIDNDNPELVPFFVSRKE